MDNQKPKTSGIFQAMAATTMIGAEMAVTVTLGFYGGRYLDRQFDTAPWLMVTGILLGVAAGIWGIIAIIKRFWDE
ncbi:MAG: AtpZ/AtpI family protein [Peptococcaceae bacterium]|nr:AtpZ/AtpI family protein [Peptococcaceae bacterium]